MNTYDNNGAQRWEKPINYRAVLTGVGVLMLAILLGFVDAVVLSGLRPDGSVSEMTVPVRVAALLSIGTVMLAIGAAASFLSAFRQSATPQIGAEGPKQAHEPLVVEEIDVFNVRRAA